MINQSMNPVEITQEVNEDFSRLSNTIARLGSEYDKERKKFKIDNRKTYYKVYPIITASENTWLIFLSKAPAERYKGLASINVLAIVYYHADEGIQVFKKMEPRGLEYYELDFFLGYNQEMNLHLKTDLEIVKHFFIQNGYGVGQYFTLKGNEYVITKTAEGVKLGELIFNKLWLYSFGFVNHKNANSEQRWIGDILLGGLQLDTEEILKGKNFDSEAYRNTSDIIVSIKRRNE